MRPSSRIPRSRRVLLSLLAVLALGATTTAMVPAQETTHTQERPGYQADRTDPADSAAVPAPTKTRPAEVAPGERCEPTRAGSRERRAGAVQACVSMSATPVKSAGRQSLAAASSAASADAAAADDDTASCVITAPGTWKFNRFGYCVNGLTVLYVLKDGNGKEIGTGTLSVTTSALLPAEGTSWEEHVTVTMTGATGAVTSLTAKFRSACSAGCKATKNAPWYGGTLVKGDSRNGRVAYSSTPAAGTQVEFTTSYELYVTAPGAQVTDASASWSNPERIRCDDAVSDTAGTPGPGCVVPSIMPVVTIDATSGAAAVGYRWAQQNLAGGWGQDKPLTRAKSGIADRTARTCGGSEPFQAMPDVVANDSCGTFPFAATHEGGTDGALCAEIVLKDTGGGWAVQQLGDTDLGRSCVRAHVPAADDQAARTQLSDGFANQRVVEAEKFKVEITGATAQPQGACLRTQPDGSLRAGDGWIRNTTAAVDHVNKTTTPDGAGTRAAMAQACLGKNLDTGSDASGDITGWQDAQLFRDTYSPKTGLARCHLIPNILGGKGQVVDGGQDNLVPCWQSGMNTGTPSMRTFELAAQKLVKEDPNFQANDALFYQVTPEYQDATSTIPVGVTMTATVQRADGTSQPLFPEVYITNTKGNTGTLNLGN